MDIPRRDDPQEQVPQGSVRAIRQASDDVPSDTSMALRGRNKALANEPDTNPSAQMPQWLRPRTDTARSSTTTSPPTSFELHVLRRKLCAIHNLQRKYSSKLHRNERMITEMHVNLEGGQSDIKASSQLATADIRLDILRLCE